MRSGVKRNAELRDALKRPNMQLGESIVLLIHQPEKEQNANVVISNKNVRRNGLCCSCGDAATRNEPYYCSQCNIRLVRIKNNRCASCSDRRCVECKIGWIEHAGRLCTKCYLAKGGTRKLCKLCNKNVPKCAGQLCRSCFSRTKNNM